MQGDGKWLRWTARLLTLAAGAWWTFFGVASGLGEGLDPLGVLIHATVPGLILLVSAAIAWRWETVGGALLILEGITAFFFFRAVDPFMLLTLPAPPFLAGILFILASWRREARSAAS